MKQHFDKPISDIIRNRHSVRTYQSEILDKELNNKLKKYIAEIKGPFDAKLRLEIIDSQSFGEGSGNKLGTYGVIRGAKTFIAAATQKEEYSMEQLGYCLEKLILYAASIGLGTCWMGGTFKRSQFAELVKLREGEIIPIVTPIGYPAEKRAFVESMMRRLAGSDNRKPWSELFFDDSFDKPLKKEAAGQYAEALEMVRLAPSASNKQPWRILKQGNEYHIFLQETKGYANALGFNMQKIDIGIAMCHFEMSAKEIGIEGTYAVKSQKAKELATEGFEYITSWVEA
ncbi:MAG: nitroreductase [Clostridia bacterium]|jgi:nitroreductase|nr:nitroreductase [Clostridia bacterium]